MYQLDGKVALITGGVRGIGLAIGRAYLDHGARVALNGRDSATGELAVKALQAGDRAIFLQGDVKVRDDIDRIIDQTVQHFGRIDILVNNAGGVARYSPAIDIPDEEFEDVLNWNLGSTFRATRKVLPYMIEQGGGRIINISSLEGKQGVAGLSTYSAAKHAVHGFTKSVAKEVGHAGITCNCICPGLVETQLAISAAEAFCAAGLGFETVEEVFAALVQQSALGRSTGVDEAAAPALLLASEVGAGITGTMISVDGGSASY